MVRFLLSVLSDRLGSNLSSDRLGSNLRSYPLFLSGKMEEWVWLLGTMFVDFVLLGDVVSCLERMLQLVMFYLCKVSSNVFPSRKRTDFVCTF